MLHRRRSFTRHSVRRALHSSSHQVRLSHSRSCVGAALLAALALTPATTRAQTDNWQTGSGYWDVAANWQGGLPGSTSDAINDTSHSITYQAGDAYTINSFLNSLAGAFNMTGGTLNTNQDFTNNGAGKITLSGGTLTVGNNYVNSSNGSTTINGGTLAVVNDLLNEGSGGFTLSSGSLTVGQSFTNSGTGTLTFSGGTATITANLTSSGVVNLSGATLSGTGAASSMLEVDNTFNLSGGATLANFTVNPGSGGQGLTVASTGGTLSGIVLNANLSMLNGGTLTLANGVSLNGASTSFNKGASLLLNGTGNTLYGSSVTFDSSSGAGNITYYSYGSDDLTIGNSTTVSGKIGAIGGLSNDDQGYSYTLTNNGTINSNLGGNTTTIETVSGFTNNGIAEATKGATLVLATATTNYGTLSTDSNSSLTLSSTYLTNAAGATINVAGTLNVTSSTLENDSASTVTANTLNLSSSSLSGSGAFMATTVNLTGNNSLSATLTATSLSAITDGASFELAGAATLNAPSATFTNGASLLVSGQYNTLNVTNLTFGSGAAGAITYDSYNNDDLIIGSGTTVSGNIGSIGGLTGANVGYSYTLTNNGVINSNVSGNTTTIEPVSSFTNNGTAEASNGVTLVLASNSITNNGTITTDATSPLTINGSYLTNAAGATLTVASTLTLNNSTLENDSASTVTASTLNLNGSTLTGSGVIAPINVQVVGSNYLTGAVTFSPSVVSFNSSAKLIVSGDSGVSLGGSNIVLNGSLLFDSNNYDTLAINSGTTLSGKIGDIGGLTGANVGYTDYLTNNGVINSNVNGNTTTIEPLSGFTNNGTVEATNGASLTLTSNSITDNGNIYIDASSTLTINDAITQTAGTTTVNGSLKLNGGASPYALDDGTINGTGTIKGNVSNTGGTVKPGDAPGTLTISGNYTQSSNGILEIELGGTQQGISYDLLDVTAKASLAGELEVKLVDGFTPTVGETFDFLTYATHSGQFSEILPFDDGYEYTVSYQTGLARLTVTVAAVPEASTLVTAGLMLGMGGLLLRRRQRSADAAKQIA
jgi:hypothetical protein